MLALNFALDFRFKSFFNIKKAFELIRHNIAGYVMLAHPYILKVDDASGSKVQP